MIHGEPQATQDERKRLCEIVNEKYKPKQYILKIFGAKSTHYYHDKNERTTDVNEASKLELKFATSLQKQIKLKTEIIQLI
jgi:hypothetical protein